MAANPAGAAPSFNDLIIASDIIDTIRHDEKLVEFELSSDERRKAFIEQLKEQKRKEGMELSDDVIAAAVDKMNEKRFVFEPMKSGLSKMGFSLYVRRGRYFRNTAIAVGVVVGGFFAWNVGYDQLVVKPRIEREHEAAQTKAAEEAALKTALQVTLPAGLKSAYTSAKAVADESGDQKALAEIEAQKIAVQAAIAAADVNAAQAGIAKIEAVSKRLLAEESARQMQDEVAEWVQTKSEALTRFTEDGNALTASAATALDSKLNSVVSAAKTGSAERVQDAEQAYADLESYVLNDAKIRIVSRDGVRTGVERTGYNNTMYYIVVEAIPDGTNDPVNVEIKNNETGKVELVPYWGVRVPKSVYSRIGQDKMSDGILDNDDAGFKPKGSLDVQWHIKTVNDQAITSW